MITEWLVLNRNETAIGIVTEKILETPMGFIFLREMYNKRTGQVTEAMCSVQCNRIQFKHFVETRYNDRKDHDGKPMAQVLRLYRGKKK